MHFSKSPSKPNYSPGVTSLLITISSLCLLYLLIISILLLRTELITTTPFSSQSAREPTALRHIAFGIASSNNSWPSRKDYVATWWKPGQTRGCVFLEQRHRGGSNTSLPPLCVSEDTSRFRYTYGRGGQRSAIRVARVVSETVALNLSGVRWFVFGDDDTVFFPENLAKTLSKYDHRLWYYIGTNSEMYEQNALHGFGMAFGGAGFAISYPLARVLAKVFDSCIQRYHHVYGSDSRVYSCVAELGVGLTREPGFHQIDIRGDMFGILASHPVTPLLSLHHLDHTNPIFPNKTSPKEALQHLFKAANIDSQRILQQSICYDKRYSWTIVVSWGYSVQIYGYNVQLPDLLHVPKTFRKWINKKNLLSGIYTFTTRELHPNPCERPTVFFLESVTSSGSGGIETTYRKSFVNCSNDANSPMKFEEVRVFSQKLDLDIKQLQAPRRHCCNVLSSSIAGNAMGIAIRECKDEELIHMRR